MNVRMRKLYIAMLTLTIILSGVCTKVVCSSNPILENQWTTFGDQGIEQPSDGGGYSGGGLATVQVVCVGEPWDDTEWDWNDGNGIHWGYCTAFSMEIQDGNGTPLTNCAQVAESLDIGFQPSVWQQDLVTPGNGYYILSGADFTDYLGWIADPDSEEGLAATLQNNGANGDTIWAQTTQTFTVDDTGASPVYDLTIYYEAPADRNVEL